MSSRKHNASAWSTRTGSSEDLLMGKLSMNQEEESNDARHLRQVTIDILPDDVLLDIFDTYGGGHDHFLIWRWKSLVHVCRRWRRIVFASPRRLRLVLECGSRTSVSKLLDTWPSLPITIRFSPLDAVPWVEDIITKLELRDRITGITLDKLRVLENLERFTTTPFPALTRVVLASNHPYPPTLIFPDAFLGGSAPQLRSFTLYNITLVELPKIVLSATRLVKLSLLELCLSVTRSYAGPEMMVTYLAALPTLEEFSVGFTWTPDSNPDLINLPHRTRVILPALTHFHFDGANDYLEDFVSRIDAPLLNALNIVFFLHHTLHIQQLYGLISRAESFKPLKKAYICFRPIDTSCMRIGPRLPIRFLLGVRGHGSTWAIELMAQLCKDLSPHFSHVEQLKILGNMVFPSALPGDDTKRAHWLKLFHSFPAVRSLFVSEGFAQRVAPVLQPTRSGEMSTDVFPALRDLVLVGFQLSGPFQEAPTHLSASLLRY